MSFTIRPAKRIDVPLIIGLAGPSGGGKTYSALRLARGLAGDKPFCVIDTENGRSQMYADVASPWEWVDFQPPFSPERYVDALKVAEGHEPPVVLLDSISHEYEGEGGLFDIREQFLEQRAGDDTRKRDALSFAAWNAAKLRHKRLLAHMLRLGCHLIVCMRAQDKIELVKENGKVKAIPKRTLTGLEGWEPICERRLPFELTGSFLLLPDKPGVPRPIKLPEPLRNLVPLDRMIGEDIGQALGEWAAGGVKGAVRPPRGTTMLPAETLEALFKARAEAGVDDAWLRAKLEEIGAPEPPQKITRAVIKSLAPAQADLLLTALNSVIDERELF